MNPQLKIFIALFLTSLSSFSQEGLPVYSDYLSDNYYLIHPSMAGASSCDKIRLTARAQWMDQSDAPALQTLSYNARVGERSGVGAIVFNDRNGYHSQKGIKMTYAHHLMFSRDEIDLNQLSFGVNANFIQSQLDETAWLQSGDYDPLVTGTIQDASYFNVDIGASYNYLDFYAHATVHNAAGSKRKIYTDSESVDLRRYLLSAGYVFGNRDKILWEPSVMFQLVDETEEKSIDLNLKAYKTIEDFGKVWAVISYRRSFDGAQYVSGTSTSAQKLQYVTPILGVNYKQFMFAYTYSKVSGDATFDTGGFHQITLGFDLNCKRERYECNCPAVN